MQQKQSKILNLPSEIVVEIFYFLEPHEIQTCAQVCNKWCTVNQHNLVWEQVYCNMVASKCIKPMDFNRAYSWKEFVLKSYIDDDPKGNFHDI